MKYIKDFALTLETLSLITMACSLEPNQCRCELSITVMYYLLNIKYCTTFSFCIHVSGRGLLFCCSSDRRSTERRQVLRSWFWKSDHRVFQKHSVFFESTEIWPNMPAILFRCSKEEVSHERIYVPRNATPQLCLIRSGIVQYVDCFICSGIRRLYYKIGAFSRHDEGTHRWW